MIGPDITTSVALRILSELERETMADVRKAAADVHRMRRGAYAAWEYAHEERLAVIAALVQLVVKHPSHVLAKGEREFTAQVADAFGDTP